jgi:transposase-like protein
MKFSKEEKAMWLEDWRRSGKSAWTYARENGLVPQTFAKWSKEKDEGQQHLVEVAVPAVYAQREALEILIEKGDTRIHVPLALGRGELRAVMEGLGCAI